MPRPKGLAKTGGMLKGFERRPFIEMREWAVKVLEQPEYRKRVEKMFRGEPATIPAWYVTTMHHYAYGKPKETVELSGPDGTALELVQVYVPSNGRDDAPLAIPVRVVLSLTPGEPDEPNDGGD